MRLIASASSGAMAVDADLLGADTASLGCDRIGDHEFAQRDPSTRATAPPDSTPCVT
jgi:hypothetical protein